MQILFGILALLFGVAGGVLFGVIGFAIAVVFAILAFVFAGKAKKNEKSGAPGIVLGIISLVFGALCTLLMIGISAVAEDEAKKLNLPIMSECGASLKFGIVGFMVEIANHQYDLDALNDELEKLKEGVNEAEATTEAVTEDVTSEE